MAASFNDLQDALRDTLDARGVLGEMKAKMRAEVYAELDDLVSLSFHIHFSKGSRPAATHESLLINELIREYLESQGMRYSLSVFLPESGQSEEPLGRSFLASQLRVEEDRSTRGRPLLYSLIEYFRRREEADSLSVTRDRRDVVRLERDRMVGKTKEEPVVDTKGRTVTRVVDSWHGEEVVEPVSFM